MAVTYPNINWLTIPMSGGRRIKVYAEGGACIERHVQGMEWVSDDAEWDEIRAGIEQAKAILNNVRLPG